MSVGVGGRKRKRKRERGLDDEMKYIDIGKTDASAAGAAKWSCIHSQGSWWYLCIPWVMNA